MFSDDSPGDLESPPLAYHQLSFDDELFTARVYKRNCRHSLMFSRRECQNKFKLGARRSNLYGIQG